VEDLVDHHVDHRPDPHLVRLLVDQIYRCHWSKIAGLGAGFDLDVDLVDLVDLDPELDPGFDLDLGHWNDRCCSCLDQSLVVGFAGRAGFRPVAAVGLHAELADVVGSSRLV